MFISELTNIGDVVLDPMQGSGTTILEASISGRKGIGFDIDPLSLIISSVKTTPLDFFIVTQYATEIINNAHKVTKNRPNEVLEALENNWDKSTKNFINYWFDIDTQMELMALLLEIDKIIDPSIKLFFKLALSAIIITKSGGVSLARDLAHTRPHRAKLVYSQNGEVIEGHEYTKNPPRNLKHSTKVLRSAIEEFEKRVRNNLLGLLEIDKLRSPVINSFGDAQNLPLPKASIDLVVTSPPYASNAIDYMRANKFSLTWFGYSIDQLSEKRKKYIGAESVNKYKFELLPDFVEKIVIDITKIDQGKGKILRRYYSEMSLVIRELYRVLKPGRAAIMVVGASEMRGRDTETQNCLSEIGILHGFQVPAIGIRNLDRNRRMLPAGLEIDQDSQIQKRMHEEFVIGFYKPSLGQVTETNYEN